MDRIALRLIIIIAFLVMLGTAAYQIKTWRDQAARLQEVEKEFSAYKADKEAADRTRRELQQEGLKDREELEAYRAKSNVRVVRVCNDPPVQAPAGAGSGDLHKGPGTGVLPEVPRPDIGPSLYAKIREADNLNLKYRKCQALVRKIYPEFAHGAD